MEDALAAHGVARMAGLRVPYFSAALAMVPRIALIATVPRRIARLAAHLAILKPPVELAGVDYLMAWHPRTI